LCLISLLKVDAVAGEGEAGVDDNDGAADESRLETRSMLSWLSSRNESRTASRSSSSYEVHVIGLMISADEKAVLGMMKDLVLRQTVEMKGGVIASKQKSKHQSASDGDMYSTVSPPSGSHALSAVTSPRSSKVFPTGPVQQVDRNDEDSRLKSGKGRGITSASSWFLIEHQGVSSSRASAKGLADGKVLWVDLLSLGKENSCMNIMSVVTPYVNSLLPSTGATMFDRVDRSKVFVCVGVVGADEATVALVREAWETLKSSSASTTLKKRMTMRGTIMYSRVELVVVSLPERSKVPKDFDYTLEGYSLSWRGRW